MTLNLMPLGWWTVLDEIERVLWWSQAAVDPALPFMVMVTDHRQSPPITRPVAMATDL